MVCAPRSLSARLGIRFAFCFGVAVSISSAAAQSVRAAPADGPHALLRRGGDLHPVAVDAVGIRAAVVRLLQGPTAAERARGVTSAIPRGTRLLDVAVDGGDPVTAHVTLDAGLLAVVAQSQRLEDAVEQLAKTVLRAGRQRARPVRAVQLLVRSADGQTRPLRAFLPHPLLPRSRPGRTGGPGTTARAGIGALAGKTIVISPGHGYYWHSTLGWTTQRPVIDGLVEDIHTAEIANRYLIPALENLGATVISCRERGEQPRDVLGDNDLPGFLARGAWGSFGGGYQNRTFLTAFTSPTGTASAEWTLPVPADGLYPVYVFVVGGANAARDARYLIDHAGGTSEVRFDQSQNPSRWALLGTFEFSAAAGARIVLDNQSPTSAVLAADAVRLGGGFGSIARGPGTSGRPRWQECSRYWTQFVGAPPSVYDTSSGQDNNDDVTARPRYAEWRGADAFLSLHTNAGGGSGTSSFIYNGTPSPGSAAFQTAVHTQLVADIRGRYDSAWVDRGRQRANFGEVRVLRTMPGVLVELAFHDRAGSKDHRALHDPRFRRLAGESLARGILRYFAPGAALPPATPTALRVVQAANRGFTIAWEPVSGATHYTVEESVAGRGFIELGQASVPVLTTAPMPHGTVRSFRVRAWNASGCSFPTEVLTAGTSHTKRAGLLLVQGFDRLGRYVKGPENTGNYLRLHGAAIRTAAEFSLGFDAASNEAISLGRVRLDSYPAVNWAAGEESTADESLSFAEQTLLRLYLNGGGRLLLSGAEIGWDLVARGTTGDQAFYASTLGARYLRDDAGVYGFRPAPGTHIFQGLAAGSFDNGSGGTYDVDYPDVIAGADGQSVVCLTYSNGDGAAIQRQVGNSRLVYLGFPLETITDADLRGEVMRRALRFLLAPRRLEAGPTVALGATLPLEILDPAAAGSSYLLAASARLGAIPLPVDHIVPLFPDVVLDVSLVPNPVFVGFRGVLDGSGRGTARAVIPNLPVVQGAVFYVSGLTIAAGGVIQATLPWVRVEVR